MRAAIFLLALILCGCKAEEPPHDSRPGFGPSNNWGGSTGLESFKASGSWGPGNQSMKPPTPGSFKGY
jgi:hypothetical protein